MKKGIVITAVILISVGLFLFVGALVFGGGLKPVPYETKTYPVNETFSDICIRSDEADIRLTLSDDESCRVECTVMGNITHTVAVQDGTLVVESVDNRSWKDRIFDWQDQLFTIGNRTITVYLPQKAYEDLSIESHTGSVELPADFAFQSIGITCTTGDVAAAASASGPIGIKTSTGDIEMENVSAQNLTLSVSTGRIAVRSAKIEGDVSVHVGTGKTEIEGLTCGSLTSDGTTGRITLKDTLLKSTLSIERSTGDVTLDHFDAESIIIRTNTGDVSGILLSEKVFYTQTSTGSVFVPRTTTGGMCEIKTSTGDITFELASDWQP